MKDRFTTGAVGVLYAGYFVVLLAGFFESSTHDAKLYYAIPYTLHFVGLGGHALAVHIRPDDAPLPAVYPFKSLGANVSLATLDVLLYTLLVVVYAQYFYDVAVSAASIYAYLVIGIVGCFGCFAKVLVIFGFF
jgi:hypothetical protein